MRKLHLAWLAASLAVVVPLVALAAGSFSTLPQVGQPSFSSGTSTGAAGQVSGPSVPAGPSFLTGLEVVPADTNIAGGASPQSVTIPVTMLGNYYSTPRNLLGNGDLLGTQVNGTAAVTCALNTTPVIAAISADRWVCQGNVAVGAGRSQIITAAPAPPTGFTNSMKVWRNSGVLLQPICVWQAVPTPTATQLQGQVVTFSAQLAAMASLAADNGSTMQMVIISGTGTDEGLAVAPTASPAITPAWTGITTVLNTTLTITTTFARYAVAATIPATATEVGVGLCFTPTANTTGVTAATDGFVFTGAQLERSLGASAFEVRPKQASLLDNQQFIWSISEGATFISRSICHFTTANSVMQCPIVFPVPMYKAPAMTYAAGFAGFTTTAETAANSCTTGPVTDASVAFVVSNQQVMTTCTIAAGTTAAVGLSMTMVDNSGTGKITAWTGF